MKEYSHRVGRKLAMSDDAGNFAKLRGLSERPGRVSIAPIAEIQAAKQVHSFAIRYGAAFNVKSHRNSITLRRLFASLNRGGRGPGNFLLNPFLGPKERDSLNAS